MSTGKIELITPPKDKYSIELAKIIIACHEKKQYLQDNQTQILLI